MLQSLRSPDLNVRDYVHQGTMDFFGVRIGLGSMNLEVFKIKLSMGRIFIISCYIYVEAFFIVLRILYVISTLSCSIGLI